MNMVSDYAGKDIHTSVVGFGQGTRAGIRMRQMALAGQGSYMHIESGNDKVEEILVEEIRKRSRR